MDGRRAVNGQAFDSNTMPVGGGRLAVSLGRAILSAASIGVGDEGEFEIEPR